MKDTIKSTYLAADFGGGSGRLIAGSLFRGKLEMEEIHRFPNRQVRLGNHIYWDFPALFEDLKTGLRLAAQKGYAVKGIGIDTWGVDFGLIDRNGNLVGNPVCYRDGRTDGLPPEVFRILDERKHYEVTGIQVMAINTLFQLYSMQKNREPQLEIARRLLFMPDLFSYFLTGVANNEYCIASTSELLDAKSRNWSEETIRALGFPEHLFGEIIQPGKYQRDAKGRYCTGNGTGTGRCHRCRFPRYGKCRSGGSGRGNSHCFPEFRHMVIAGGGNGGADIDGRSAPGPVHQRRGCGRTHPLFAEYHGAVDSPTADG